MYDGNKVVEEFFLNIWVVDFDMEILELVSVTNSGGATGVGVMQLRQPFKYIIVGGCLDGQVLRTPPPFEY